MEKIPKTYQSLKCLMVIEIVCLVGTWASLGWKETWRRADIIFPLSFPKLACGFL
jgi:hypothetical protein